MGPHAAAARAARRGRRGDARQRRRGVRTRERPSVRFLAQSGLCLSSSEAAPAGGRGSARLGLTLRSVLLSPHDGFAAALKSTERRSRAGRRPAEGLAPYVLAAVGGA